METKKKKQNEELAVSEKENTTIPLEEQMAPVCSSPHGPERG